MTRYQFGTNTQGAPYALDGGISIPGLRGAKDHFACGYCHRELHPAGETFWHDCETGESGPGPATPEEHWLPADIAASGRHCPGSDDVVLCYRVACQGGCIRQELTEALLAEADQATDEEVESMVEGRLLAIVDRLEDLGAGEGSRRVELAFRRPPRP